MFARLKVCLTQPTISGGLMLAGAAFSLSPPASSASALVLGIFLSVVSGNPFVERTRVYAQKLLALSVVGLGAGMNLVTVGQAGLAGLGYTVVTIAGTLGLGLALGRLFKSESQTSLLIAVGTAICGGSAIAAVAPVIRAKPQAITVAMGAVFLLNTVALLALPGIGHFFGLSQNQFGIWSALAIHDTSSVIGACLQFGAEATQTGTTVKLARALWIVPLAIGLSFVYRGDGTEGAVKAKKPWFILGFIVMAAIVTWVPQAQAAGHVINGMARQTLILTLFLIGSNLTLAVLRKVGFAPMLQALCLWLAVVASTLAFVKFGVS